MKVFAKVLGWQIVVVMIIAAPALAKDKTAAQQLLDVAEQQASLYSAQTDPFQLEVDFTAQMNVPVQGHLSLKWQAKDKWWRKIDVGGFEEIDVRNGEKLYKHRNIADFTPIRVSDLEDLVLFANEQKSLVAKKDKRRIENGIAIDCVQAEPEGTKNDRHEICVAEQTHDILSDTWHLVPDDTRTQQFADYFSFGAHRYPRELTFVVNASKVISAHVVTLETAPFDSSLLSTPPGWIERRQCAGLKHPVPVHTPDPTYPKSAVDNRIGGDATFAMTVLADGSVSDIHLIGRATESMDKAAFETLRTWRFKPAMCGSEPVVADIQVVVSFRLEH